LSLPQVKVWFQNRRIKWRKQSLEQQQAKLAKMGLATPQRSPDSQSHHGEEDKDFPAESEDGQEDTASSPRKTHLESRAGGGFASWAPGVPSQLGKD
uniref:Homeobox domain-containing protein n=1 Tax=Buteo japonicus TaxID=224669 RepID=A0A8C0B4T8_9AVES